MSAIWHRSRMLRFAIVVLLGSFILAAGYWGVRVASGSALNGVEPLDPDDLADMIARLRTQEERYVSQGSWVYRVLNAQPTRLPEAFDESLFRMGLAQLTVAPSYSAGSGGIHVPPTAKVPVDALPVLEVSDGELLLLSPEQFYAFDESGRECHEFVRYRVSVTGALLSQEVVRRVVVPGEGGKELIIYEKPRAELISEEWLADTSYDTGTQEGVLTPWGFGLGFDYEAGGPRPVSVGLSEYDSVGRIETERANWILLQAEMKSPDSPVGRLLLEEDAASRLLRVLEVAWYPPDASAGDIEVEVESWLMEDERGATSVIPGSAVRARIVEEPSIESPESYELLYDVVVFDRDGAIDDTLYEIVTEPGTVVYDERVVGGYGIEPPEGVTEPGAVQEAETTAAEVATASDEDADTTPTTVETPSDAGTLSIADILKALRRQESYLSEGGIWVYIVKSTEPSVLPESFDEKLFRQGVAALIGGTSYKQLGIVRDNPKPRGELSVESYVVLDDDGENRITLLCPEQFYLLDAEGRECHEFVRYTVAYSGALLSQEIVRRTFVPGEGAQEVVVTETPGGARAAVVRLGDISYDILTPEGQMTPWGFGLSFDYKAMGPRPMTAGLSEWDLSLVENADSHQPAAEEAVALVLTLKAEHWTAAPSVPCVGSLDIHEEQKSDNTILCPFGLAWHIIDSSPNDTLEVAVTSWLEAGDLPQDAVIPRTAQRAGTLGEQDENFLNPSSYSYELAHFTQTSSAEASVYASMFEMPADPTTAVQDDRGPGLYEVVEPMAAILSSNGSKAEISVDLDIWNGGSDLDNGESAGSQGSAVSDEDESDPCKPGACLLVNRDDDDNDDTSDLTDTTVSAEDNLAKITLALNDWTEEDEGHLSLSLGSGLTAWKQSSKVEQQTDLSWDLGDLHTCPPRPPEDWPSTLWIQASSSGVKYITLLYTPEVGDSTGDGVKLTVVDLSLFTAGHTPYDRAPLISTFVTNTETTCAINATASDACDWTPSVPSGWTCASQTDSQTFAKTATVPTHPDGGRAAGWQITLNTAPKAFTFPFTVTATQSATDRIRQMHVDHSNGLTPPDHLKIPARAHFDGGTAIDPLLCQSAFNGLECAYRDWCEDLNAVLPIDSGYRNPEYNEDIGGSTRSMHMYGMAIDISPMNDYGGDPGKQDDTEWVYDHRTNYDFDGYCYIDSPSGPDDYNKLHLSTTTYDTLPHAP